MSSVLSSWLLLPPAWLLADGLHSLLIAFRRRRWERSVGRGPDGVRVDAAPLDAGDGPVAVLCIHGFGDVPAAFRSLQRRLVEGGGVRVRALRLPGAGETPAAAARHTVDDWLAAVAGEAAALRARHRQVWLLGHSMGGAIALAAALHDPAVADGVALLSPLLRVSGRRSPVLPPRAWFALARASFPFSAVFESCFSAELAPPDRPEDRYRRDRFIPFATYRNLFALLDRIRPRAGAWRLPLVALLAGRDRVVDTAAALDWLARCPAGPRRLVRVLPDAPHDLPMAPEWKVVTDAVRSFIFSP